MIHISFKEIYCYVLTYCSIIFRPVTLIYPRPNHIMSKLLFRTHLIAMSSMVFFLTSLSGQNEAEAEGGEAAAPAAGGETAAPAAGGETAAPAAAPAAAPPAASLVTGAAAPAPAVSSAVESNPVSTAVNAGLSATDAVALGSSNLKKLADKTHSGGNVKTLVKQFQTRSTVVKTFVATGKDLSTIVSTAVTQLDKDNLSALGELDATHMTSLAGTPNLDKIDQFATKAEVVKVYRDLGEASAITNVIAKANTLDTDNLASLKELDPTHMKTIAADGLGKIDQFAPKAEVVKVYRDLGEASAITSVLAKANTLDADNLLSLKDLDPVHMKTIAADGIDKIDQFATKAEVAKVYKDKSGAGADLGSIMTNVQTLEAGHLTALKDLKPADMAALATSVEIAAVKDVGRKAKVVSAYAPGGTDGKDIASILTSVNAIAGNDLLNYDSMEVAALTLLAGSVDIANVAQEGAHRAKAVAAGYNINDALALTGDALTAVATSTKDELASAQQAGTSLADHAGAKLALSANAEIDSAAKAVKAEAKYQTGLNVAVENAVKVAELLLTDRMIQSEANFPPDVSVQSLSQSGYNFELVRILAKYGALGSKGSVLADAVLGANYAAFGGTASLSDSVQPNTSYYQQFLAQLGARSLGPSKTSNSIFSLPTSKVFLQGGANIVFDPGAEIDINEKLPAGTREIHVIGAAKDMIIKGNLNFDNVNTTENHATVLGAADDLYFRSEYSASGNHAHYDNPPVVSITNSGSNLALGAEDTIRMVNVSIQTGGNLAIGTLQDLHIGTNTAQQNTLSVGTGGVNSDPDNVYLYAHNLIQINGLQITGRVDDVYMEAATINLRNVVFPNTTEVTLRSRDGTIGFNQFANPIVGGVNMENVKHGTTLLQHSSFNGSPGNWATNKVQPNGTPAVQIKKF